MDRIECSVTSCSHNKGHVCYSNRVNIGGKSAEKEGQTCCGSFLNRVLYSDLTNNTNSQGSCDTLVCFVKSCRYNENTLCDLKQIHVGGNSAEIYDETLCESFDKK
ncbi:MULTISPECIES: DUF1540 domain-containing protein [Clostridium]|uniref:DUF1540 domain-containing protein n=1 Tax=Clostridium cibarium TaxID=2762247 RepID=A0ABR8PQM9_9CLOT|nr:MULTISPECIES: DUF1540 domain-containing protein [Clostridium]MBD7910481.1 DUF1540 domain-containing protein [Clostridium cibarium]